MDEMGTRHMPLMYFYNVVRNHESLHATLNVTLGLRTDSELNTKGFERLFSNPTPFNHHAHFKVDRDKNDPSSYLGNKLFDSSSCILDIIFFYTVGNVYCDVDV